MKSSITGKASVKINASAAEVWEALTNPEIIKKYFFNTDTHTNWEVGSPVTFTGEWEGKTYEDKGSVMVNEHEKMLQYSYWSSMSGIEDKPENYATITYQLQEEDGKTTLEITQENIQDEKSREHSEQNWNMVLGNLKKLLENKQN